MFFLIYQMTNDNPLMQQSYITSFTQYISGHTADISQWSDASQTFSPCLLFLSSGVRQMVEADNSRVNVAGGGDSSVFTESSGSAWLQSVKSECSQRMR